MQVISNANQFNPQVSGVYILLKPQFGFVKGNPTNVIGVVGTASWGEIGVPYLFGSPQDMYRKIGGIQAAALTDKYDMPTEVELAFGQQQGQNGMQIWGVRVGDGTEAKSAVILQDTTADTPLNGLTLTAKCPGKLGDQLKVAFEAGSLTNTVTARILPFTGADPEEYANLPSSGAGVFWTNLRNAINNGTALRGPSELVTAGTPNASAIAPALGTFSLTGGADGRASVNSAALIGSEGSGTGMYALAALDIDPKVNMFWLAGLTDTTVWATMVTFANRNGMVAASSFATGTSVSSAISAKKTLGLDTPNFVALKDFVRFFDPVNGQQRMVPPTAVYCGRNATLGPHESPGNKEVYGITATEQSRPYSLADLALLENNGIDVITNPIERGRMFGIRHGLNTSSNRVYRGVEYSKMTNYLVAILGALAGPFIKEPHTAAADDPTREAVRSSINSFLSPLADKGRRWIEGFRVQCDDKNNSAQSVANGYLICEVTVKYVSIVETFTITLDAGRNVVIVGNAPGGQLAA